MRPLLATGIGTHLVTRFRGGFCLATWMRTNGTLLLAIELCSLACVRLEAKDSRSAPRLRYFSAAAPRRRSAI